MSILAILLPTLNRSEVLPDLIDQIAANTGTPHKVYLGIETPDEATKKVSETLDTIDVIGYHGSCAAAYNSTFQASEEPYCFLANDDLEFPKGWEVEALSLIDDTPIVGVNEGHGRMTCFAMVRRSYIEEHSGVYDKPATLVHPYRSQYVDTELAEYAKHRGVWGEAHAGVIHRHWEFGDADASHPNYQKAQEHLAADHATYEHRKREWQT